MLRYLSINRPRLFNPKICTGLSLRPGFGIFDSNYNASVFAENDEEKAIKKIFKALNSTEADLTPEKLV